MNDRERATVLAALRLWQQTLPAGIDSGLMDIAREGHRFSELDSEEIGDLCERLNTHDANETRIVELARSQYAREGEIEIDDDAEVSFAHDHERGEPCHNADPDGAYVQAWLWVDLEAGR